MRTYEYSKTTDSLGRYYTDTSVSRFLVDQLPCQQPAAILDLGAGEGALTLAASAKWSSSLLITVDIDGQAANKLPNRLRNLGFNGRHSHLREDALAAHLPNLLAASHHRLPEVGICNPPFIVPHWRKIYSELLEEVGLSGSLPSITSTDAAVLFLAQNLRLIAGGGALGIIVPDSLVNADKYLRFRAKLLERYTVLRAIRLPRGSFKGTDALAHILVISKSKPATDKVELSCLGGGDALSATRSVLFVDRDQATRRLDYTFHAADANISPGSLRLRDVCSDLRRGSLNSAQARAAAGFVLHTTHLQEAMCGGWIDFSAEWYRPARYPANLLTAQAGDIIVARVGRTAAQKVIGIANGCVVLSDCLYRLQVPPKHRRGVLAALSSASGQAWLENHAYGVAARQLTKTDLLNLPLSL